MASYDVVVKIVDQTKASTRSIENNLTSIQTRADQANKTLAKLGTGLGVAAGAAVAGFSLAARNALAYASSIKDASDATNISVASILALGQALVKNGGNASDAAAAVVRFSDTIGQAVQGSESARKALSAVGISLKDLQTLSETDLFLKSIEGLGKVEDASSRTTLQTQLYTKTLKGVGVAGFADDIRRLTGEQAKNAQATKNAGDASDNLAAATNKIGTAILNAISPLTRWLANLDDNQISNFVKILGTLTAAFILLATTSVIVTGIQAIATVMGVLGISLGAASVAALALTAKIVALGVAVAVVAQIIGKAFGVDLFDMALEGADKLIDKLKGIAGMTAAPAAVASPVAAAAAPPINRKLGNATIDAFNESLKKAREEYAIFLALSKSPNIEVAAAAFQRLSSAADQLGRVVRQPTTLVLKEFSTELQKTEEDLRRQEIKFGDTGLMAQKYALEIRAGNLALSESQARLKDTQTLLALYNIELDNEAITLAKQNVLLTDAASLTKKFANEVNAADNALTENAARLASNSTQLALFRINLENSRIAVDQQKKTLELLNASYSSGKISLTEYADALGQLNERLLGVDQVLARAQSAGADEARSTDLRRSAVERLIQSYKDAGGAGTAAFRATAEALKANGTEIDLVVAQYGNYADSILERNQAIKDSIFDASKTFVDEFTTAFIQGKAGLKNFGDFFSNILNDIAAQLIRQQIARPIANVLSSFIGSLIPGLATGGPATAGQPYVIGERGPELFVPGTNGTVIPNDQLAQAGSGSGGTNALTVNFTINAVDTQTGVQFLLQNKPVITGMISDAYNRRGRRGPLD